MTWVTPVAGGASVEVDRAQGIGASNDVPKTKPAAAQAEGLSFGDLVDVFNPLQHIPGVAELYRKMTGDQISDRARFAGNALFGLALGGPVGMSAMTAYSIAGEAVETFSVDKVAESEMIEAQPVPSKEDAGPAELAETGKAEGNGMVLGEHIATTGLSATGKPINLAALLSDVATHDAKPVPVAAEPKDAAGARISETGLEKIVTHKANHLPLDVLKALQERHAARAPHEPS